MEKIKNEKNGLIQSQKSLYIRLKRINQLFKFHLSSLILFFLLAAGFAILWAYLLFTGQASTGIAQRYGLFGTIVTIFMTVILSLLIIQIGIQIIFYGLFIIRGNRSLKQAKGSKEKENTLYDGIVPFISNFYAFFNRFSKEKTTLVKLVRTFLFLNFFSGFFVILLSSRFLDPVNTNFLINIFRVTLFLSVLCFWLMNLITSSKIKKEIVKWEKLFPKLEEWAQELERLSSKNSILIDEEEPQ